MAVNATAIWRVRPSGSNTNGGGYDPGIAGAATDYSQQNAAQATGTLGTATGTTTFTDAGGAFTALMVGNALWIASGAGFTVGAYFITAFGSSTSVTLDRSPGTGTVAHWAVGGGWADPITNPIVASAPVVPGNTIFVLGSGTPNPSSYTYDYTTAGTTSFPVGNNTAGCITIANDPSTPGYLAPPNTTGGMPVIKVTSNFVAFHTGLLIKGLWFVYSAISCNCFYAPTASTLSGCVVDIFGKASGTIGASFGAGSLVVACEVFDSVGGGGGNTIINTNAGSEIIGCNIHDISASGTVGINVFSGAIVLNNIIAKLGSDALQINNASFGVVIGNTIDANVGSGINFLGQTALGSGSIAINNIISNHTTGGTYGMTVGAGTTAANNQVKQLVDYNVFYNNTSNYNAISAGTHDTALGTTPYVGQSTENYTLA